MKDFISKFTKSSIISSIILFAFALLLIIQSEATIIAISYVIGGILVALGVLAELKFIKNVKENPASLDVIYGAVCVILGVLVITNPKAIASVLPFVIGFIIIINSATKLQYSFELRKAKNELWLSTLILSIIMTICGVALIFNPFQGAKFLMKIIGGFILVYAVLDLVSTFVIRNTFKKIQTAITENTIKEATVIEEKKEEIAIPAPVEETPIEEPQVEETPVEEEPTETTQPEEETSNKKKKKKDK